MNNNEIDVLDQIKNAKQDLRLKHEETEKELKEPIIALYRKVDTFLLALAKTLLEREPFHSFIFTYKDAEFFFRSSGDGNPAYSYYLKLPKESNSIRYVVKLQREWDVQDRKYAGPLWEDDFFHIFKPYDDYLNYVKKMQLEIFDNKIKVLEERKERTLQLEKDFGIGDGN